MGRRGFLTCVQDRDKICGQALGHAVIFRRENNIVEGQEHAEEEQEGCGDDEEKGEFLEREDEFH